MSNSVHTLEDLANRDSDPLAQFILKITARLITLEERVAELEYKVCCRDFDDEGFDDAN